MAIKINGQDLLKRFINGQEIVRVYKQGIQIRPETVPPVFDDYLCFTAEQSNSSVALNNEGSPYIVSLEISYNKNTWMDYTIGGTIALSNVGDKVYFRNKSETPTGFSNGDAAYMFSIGGRVAASGDVTSLLCKEGTTELTFDGCFANLFLGCRNLTTPPNLPATTLTEYCYYYMFEGCNRLRAIPQLPATTLPNYCYSHMFMWTSISLSETQTGGYQNPYRIPSSGTGTEGVNSLESMFSSTWGDFKGTPSINTTYYTSNQVI